MDVEKIKISGIKSLLLALEKIGRKPIPLSSGEWKIPGTIFIIQYYTDMKCPNIIGYEHKIKNGSIVYNVANWEAEIFLDKAETSLVFDNKILRIKHPGGIINIPGAEINAKKKP